MANLCRGTDTGAAPQIRRLKPMTASPVHIGIDLAWGAKNRTGLAAVAADGRLLASGDPQALRPLRGQSALDQPRQAGDAAAARRGHRRATRWGELRSIAASATKHGDLNRIEDEVDGRAEAILRMARRLHRAVGFHRGDDGVHRIGIDGLGVLSAKAKDDGADA